ncbi:MAG: hypothetical protein A3I61_14090 [Acidobacteria bacterium RIFCSPLOWO2_02_FULL_68_18]|nr:MAG: hypothetical protein A3I61_14090 [Acidobacteria bacterium RIFCSPLOWO2_02_FULL_68_18]OFW50018.1 MAG: hypothetical protein A3G77_08860 [Acidobacteria bacterium RIFCSPLOWO2_12_FULL_68_19]
MTESTLPETPRERLVHEFKNHLSVIVGFCDVLLRELPEGDAKRADLAQIQRAALAAVALLPELPGHASATDA